MTPQNITQVSIIIVLFWHILLLYRRNWEYWHFVGYRKPTKSRKRTTKKREPKPFAGLTRQPECALCTAEAATHAPEVARVPPPKITRVRGRPVTIDTHRHFCPDPDCDYYGWLGLGNIIANGHPSGGTWRQLQCVVCGHYFQETLGTVFYGSPIPAETILRAIASLCEGVSPRKVARIFGVDKDTVLGWLVAAAQHSEAVIGYMVQHLELTQVQMDELYALLRGMREGGKRPPCWVWTAMDACTKLWVAVVVGDRSEQMAQCLVHGVVRVLAPGVVPLFLTDQLAAYGKAVLGHFGHWVEKDSENSNRILRRWLPLAQLQYAQVAKKRRRRKIVAVTTRVVFGTQQAVAAALAAVGHKINTAFVERLNRTLRAHVPGLARRAEDVAQTQNGLLQRLHLVMGYYNFCLPHLSLQEALPQPLPTKGQGSPKRWRPRTPAMAAGITDHVWTMRELLLLRVPPWRQEVTMA
jgi:IS1 family transposase